MWLPRGSHALERLLGIKYQGWPFQALIRAVSLDSWNP
nr:MAG TPA: hypothetical protein [Caudoviricetes sp.]